MKKRILAAVIAAVFAVLNVALALPVFALDESTTRYPTPEGYNDNDYQKLVAFLEQTDDEGVKNGDKLSENYDPNDPTTWGTDNWDEQRFQWTESDGELRIERISVYGRILCGALDVSGCTALEYLYCPYNNLTTLDVSGCTALWGLYCSNNNLTSLDVSSNTALDSLSCYSNNLTELDLSRNPYLPLDCVKSEGNGTIGCIYHSWDEYGEVTAVPNSGAEFIGWFNEAGELIVSANACYGYDNEYWLGVVDGIEETVYIAKFTEAEPIPGDADGDGELTSDDVLLLMRAVMGIDELTDEMLANCDMNGDGVVNFTDALIMLRMVLNTQPNISAY